MTDQTLPAPPVSTQSIATTVFTVLDLETTGGKPPDHRITEIAAYRIEGMQITEHFQTLVNPRRNVPSFVSSLTGITNAMLKGQPASSEVLGDLLDFTGESVVVAHHSEFDRKFLNSELRSSRLPLMNNPDLCTCRLARRILPWLPSKSLGNLAAFFGLEVENRHRAASDALAAARLLLIFLNYLQHRGLETYHDVELFQHNELGYRR
jgi:DNA polymerase III epsilon subunit family exonuclease